MEKMVASAVPVASLYVNSEMSFCARHPLKKVIISFSVCSITNAQGFYNFLNLFSESKNL